VLNVADRPHTHSHSTCCPHLYQTSSAALSI